MEIIFSVIISVVVALILIKIFADRQNSRIFNLESRIKNKNSDDFKTKVETILNEQNEFRRQQKTLFDLSSQFESTLENLYKSLKEEIRKLNEKIDRIPISEHSDENDIKKIAENTAKKISEDTSKKIQSAVESAVLKKINSDLMEIVQEKFDKNFSASVDDKIKKSVSLIVEEIVQKQVNSLIQKNLPQIVQNQLNAANLPQIIQSQVNAAIQQNIFPLNQKISELKKTSSQSSNASLIKIIGEQKKSIDELRAEIEEIKKNFPISSPSEEKILKIRDEKSWNTYKEKLQNLDELKNFVAVNRDEFKWFKIEKIEVDVNKLKTPSVFNDDTTEKIVTSTVKIAKRFIGALDSCEREIKNPKKNSSHAQKLKNLIEEYFLGIGIKSMNFKPGDDYEEWADLGMDGEIISDNTDDKTKHDKLKEIYVQPHFLEFIDAYDEKSRRVFGGSCSVYVFRQ